MKIVVNRCFGGFGLSAKAQAIFRERGGEYDTTSNYRTNPILINMVETMDPKELNTPYSNLGIIEIPDDVDWEIAEYDGHEHVAEKHRTWY